jgi:FKBP-type peptidyl-prolyl cis-trans isomerase SlyD
MTRSSRREKSVAVLVTAIFILALAPSAWAKAKKGGVVADGMRVSIEYTLTLEDGSKIDSNVGKEPLMFIQGTHKIVPGLEKRLTGLKAGETRRIEVPPEEGYGEVDPARKEEVDKSNIPEAAWKIGVKLTRQKSNGEMTFAEVKEVTDKTVILDRNHPLAGKKLIFDVKVLKVEDTGFTGETAPCAIYDNGSWRCASTSDFEKTDKAAYCKSDLDSLPGLSKKIVIRVTQDGPVCFGTGGQLGLIECPTAKTVERCTPQNVRRKKQRGK